MVPVIRQSMDDVRLSVGSVLDRRLILSAVRSRRDRSGLARLDGRILAERSFRNLHSIVDRPLILSAVRSRHDKLGLDRLDFRRIFAESL